MQKLGYILIVLGFLGASYMTVLDPTLVSWGRFLPLAAVAVVGVLAVRISTRQQSTHVDTIAANIEDISTSLGRLVENVTKLNREKETINTYDMRHKVDELLRDDLETFADARETIAHKYGLNAYAEIMSHFAAGERYINRVWSASADGYVDEVNAYLAKAQEQVDDVQRLFTQMQQSTP